MASLIEPLIFFIASLTTLVLIYYKLPVVLLQQIVLALLIILLLSFRFLVSDIVRPIIKKTSRFILLFLTALFVQILVISSGGFYSPLLILLHLYTLGVSFLLNTKSSISFLFFSVLVLVSYIFWDPKIKAIFQDDPGTVVLYVVSFIVIIPLIQTLIRTYHLKDKIAQLLAESLNLRALREKSIWKSLNEIIVITDKDLKIISANDAFEKASGMSNAEILNHNFFDEVHLVDQNNNPADVESLSVSNVLRDQTNHIVSGFHLTTKMGSKTKLVNVEVKPIIGLDGKIRQVVFVIKDPITEYQSAPHSDLDKAYIKKNKLFENIQRVLMKMNVSNLKTDMEFIHEAEHDLSVAQELEDHGVELPNNYEDVGILCKNAIFNKQELAKNLGVNLQLIFADQEPSESSYLHLREENPNLIAQVISAYTARVNVKWFNILIKKLLDLAIMIASTQQNPEVELQLSLVFNESVMVSITASAPALIKPEMDELFLQYYGSLMSKTNLKFASGLEGFLAKTIAEQSDIPLLVKFKESPNRIIFQLTLDKQIKTSSNIT